MFYKSDAERLFNQYGFNQKTKNDETIRKTAKAFDSNEYIGTSRNRLNSGILRNQFLLLLDPLNGKPLSNQTFSGVTLLRDDQYALVHQDPKSELWEVYQGNTPYNPRLIYKSITLQSFFDEMKKQENHEPVSEIEIKSQEPSNKKDDFLQKRLEEYAEKNGLFVFVDSSGDRVIFYNGCIIAVFENKLFACIVDKVSKLYRSQIESMMNEKYYWHLCYAAKEFPNSPYNRNTEMSILASDKDVCLYIELDDESKFENLLDELLNYFPVLKEPFKHSPFTPAQIIYYGVPGCGKSHKITTMLKDEKVKDSTFSEENQVVRTTFHPEYTNADFIGQILPEVHENTQGTSVVEYKFKPGPFAKILKQALHNPSKPFYLVIEEINRGNAAAIFGDVFQLLDRLKTGETSKEPIGTDGFENHYGKGWSEYFVMNADVNAYIRDANNEDELDTKAIDISGIHFSSSTGLRLPPNLSIYATMNTSDQNVFTLDNAFQRRWDMELVPNICNWNDADHKKQAQLPIGDTDIRWETFRDAVNSEISGGDFFNADDKQLGLFFIEADGEKIDQKKFANKVLKYLWADVFKRDTGKIFKSENLSKVVEDFTGTDAFDKVFTDEFAQSLKDTNDAIKNR